MAGKVNAQGCRVEMGAVSRQGLVAGKVLGWSVAVLDPYVAGRPTAACGDPSV